MSNHPTHTPGPWRAAGTLVYPDNQWHERKAAVAQCAMSHGIGEAGEQDKANARLIAASPIMKGQLETGHQALGDATEALHRGETAEALAIIRGVMAGNEIAIAAVNEDLSAALAKAGAQ